MILHHVSWNWIINRVWAYFFYCNLYLLLVCIYEYIALTITLFTRRMLGKTKRSTDTEVVYFFFLEIAQNKERRRSGTKKGASSTRRIDFPPTGETEKRNLSAANRNDRAPNLFNGLLRRRCPVAKWNDCESLYLPGEKGPHVVGIRRRLQPLIKNRLRSFSFPFPLMHPFLLSFPPSLFSLRFSPSLAILWCFWISPRSWTDE